MKNPLLILAAVFGLTSSSALAEQRFVYSSAGGAVSVYEVDLATGKLKEIQSNPGMGLTAISSDQKFLYRVGGGEIESYRIQKNGKLKSIGKDKTSENGGYLALDGNDRFLAGSNYGGGSVTVWEIGEDKIGIGDPVAIMALEKTAHSSLFSPGNGFLIVPATSPNKVFQLKFDDRSGSIEANDPLSVSGPTGEDTAQQPRHIIFHPNGEIAYTTLEREIPGVGVWRWDESIGQLELLQNIITFPENWEGTITTADLHLTPDAKFLYVSNRDLTDRKAVTGDSSIVGFKVDPETQLLEMIGHTPCPQVPRSFAIDRAGEYVYVAGQTAAKLAIYQLNDQTGELSLVEEIDTAKGPNWVKCVTISE
ncbi:MAG: beta-propeller fold lactonase family protein [Verrucomicrobiota bacterium]